MLITQVADAHDVINLSTPMLQAYQGGGTPIHSVLRAATTVKMKVNSQFEILSTVNSQATIYLFDVINYTVKGQANFRQKTHNCKINVML